MKNNTIFMFLSAIMITHSSLPSNDGMPTLKRNIYHQFNTPSHHHKFKYPPKTAPNGNWNKIEAWLLLTERRSSCNFECASKSHATFFRNLIDQDGKSWTQDADFFPTNRWAAFQYHLRQN